TRIPPAPGAPRPNASAPCLSVSSRWLKPPRPRSNTPCTRQSVPLLARWLIELPLGSSPGAGSGGAQEAARPPHTGPGRYRHHFLEELSRLVQTELDRRV